VENELQIKKIFFGMFVMCAGVRKTRLVRRNKVRITFKVNNTAVFYLMCPVSPITGRFPGIYCLIYYVYILRASRIFSLMCLIALLKCFTLLYFRVLCFLLYQRLGIEIAVKQLHIEI